jgi:hypothetical protein
MAQQIQDRVKETTTTTGTGPLALLGGMTGFRAFSSVCSVGDTAYYSLQSVDVNGNPLGAWEVGIGTYSAAATLTRTTILASSNAGAAVNLAAGTTQVWLDVPAAQIRALAVDPGYINGFTLSNDGTAPNTVLDIAAGSASDSTNATAINGTAFTKSTAGTWVAGSGNNGMGTGLTIAASTWYHVFAIIKGGSFDVYFDTSATAANAPSGTTAFRYIGSFKTTSGAAIFAFTQYGQKFVWTSSRQDLSSGTATTSTPVTLSVPLGFVTHPILSLSFTASAVNSQLTIYPGTSTTETDCLVSAQIASVANTGQCTTTTNTSGQISYLCTGSSPSATIVTSGYINPHVAPNW